MYSNFSREDKTKIHDDGGQLDPSMTYRYVLTTLRLLPVSGANDFLSESHGVRCVTTLARCTLLDNEKIFYLEFSVFLLCFLRLSTFMDRKNADAIDTNQPNARHLALSAVGVLSCRL